MSSGMCNYVQTPVTASFYALGTNNRLRVYGRDAEKAVFDIKAEIEGIEGRMSVFRPDSDISVINRKAGGMPVKVGNDTFFVIKKAVEYAALTQGVFEPTVRPLVNLWGIGTRHAKVPAYEELKRVRRLVDYRGVLLDERSHTVGLARRGQLLDLGAIAKGYAADAAGDVLRRHGITSALIDLGGNIVAYGTRPVGEEWSIGIRDPKAGRGRYACIVRVKDKAVVTSGGYERFFYAGGRMYHHIIDPRTGKPSDNGVASVTVIAASSTDCDALATALFISGPEEGMEYLKACEGAEAVFIMQDGEILASPGLATLVGGHRESSLG